MFDIPGYTINTKLAEGACAEILLAVQQSTGRLVVIKILRPAHIHNRVEQERLKRETVLCLRLKHENVIAAYAGGALGMRPFVVIEYVRGATLRELITQRKQLSNVETLKLASAVGQALNYLHQGGICHRDIKPDNILIGLDGRIKLIDFGFAGRLTALTVWWRRREGSPPYMAPEMILKKKSSVGTDIYALGCTLYEAAAGIQPFGGMSDKEVIRKQSNVNLAAQPVQVSNPNISPLTQRMIMKAVEKDPERRYRSVEELLLDLRRNPAWPSAEGVRLMGGALKQP